jgi:hypothetical protein
MNSIYITTPSDPKGSWRTCQIISAEISHVQNSATLKVKGVSRHENVNTTIIINDLKTFVKGEPVDSIHKYFKLKMHEATKELFKYEI